MQESIAFLVCVQCRRKESSRSLSHLLMSLLFCMLATLYSRMGGLHTGVKVVCNVQALAAQLGAKPEFIVAGTSYRDINQGQLGTPLP